VHGVAEEAANTFASPQCLGEQMMIKSEIASYMERTFLFQFDDEINESTDLFKSGVMDSHGYIQLMRFLESAFHIKFTRDELLSAVITSLTGLVTVVEAKVAAEKK
jgi:acyl carrier protein